MFFPPNKLAELVRQPGGKPRDAAIADAGRNIDEQRDYLAEGIREAVHSIEAVIPRSDGPAIPSPLVEIILQGCDRIIGLAGVLGYQSLEAAAKSLCDLIACLARSGEIERAPVLVHVQALQRLSERPAEVSAREAAVLIDQLARLVGHYANRA
jgi:hypothetical protein